MEDESFANVLESLKNPPNSLRREARIVRRTAVVLAVLDVVGDAASASKIYAQCITALEGTLTSDQTTGTQIALLEVLCFVIPHVDPPAILSATLPLTSRVLRALVALGDQAIVEHSVSDDKTGGGNAVLRWVAKVSSILIVRLPNADEKEVKQLLNASLLNLFTSRRPKVRKAAQNHVIEMLSSEHGCPRIVVTTISSFCHQQMAKPLAEISKSLSTGNMDWYQQSCHLFAFLERAIVFLNFSKLTEQIMKLLASLLTVSKQNGAETFLTVKIKQNTPRVLAISSLASVMLVMLQDENESRKDAIDALAPRVLASVLQGQATVVLNEDAAEFDILDKARIVCGQIVLQSCSRSLQSHCSKAATIKLMPLAIHFVRNLCLPSVDGDITVSLTLMVELAQLFRTVLPHLRKEATLLSSCMDILQTVVKEPKYRPTWPVSLKCVTLLLPYLSDDNTKAEVFESLLAAYAENTSNSSKSAIRESVSALVQEIGIEETWKWIVWEPRANKGGIASDRAWLLSTLKSSSLVVSGGSKRLDFFQSSIMPMARKCDHLAAHCSLSERNFHRMCVVRLWELFPCFCASPDDIEEIFPSLSETLCKALEDTRYPELLITICNGLSVLVKSTENAGSFELEDSSAAAQAIGTASMRILPTLFRIVSDAHTSGLAPLDEKGEMDQSNQSCDKFQKLQNVTDAIAAVSRLAPPDFLQGMFKKVMQRLLEQVQLDAAETDRICALLTLAKALVASKVLDDSSVSFLYRALKPLIKDEEQEPRSQKRAYKVLLELCERYPSLVTTHERLGELCELLTSTMANAQISARYMRLRCMNAVVKTIDGNGEYLSLLKGVTPEVLLCLKDSNGKTRDAAYQLLLTIAASGQIMEHVNTVLAGLGAETVHMRSAAVLALSRIVFEYGRENKNVQDILPHLLQTVLLLLGQGTRETVKSVVGFLRICVSAIPPDRLEPLVPELLRSLMKSQLAKNRFRSKVKIIIKKLVKLYGYDELMRYIPEADSRILTHMRKLEEREKRRRQNSQQTYGTDIEDFEGMIDSDEEDSDDGRTLMTGATGLTKKTMLSQQKSQGSRATKALTRASTLSRNESKKSGIRLLDSENGETVDMLGRNLAGKVHFAPDDESDDDSMDDAMEFNDEGKLVVRDDAEVARTIKDDGDSIQNNGFQRKRGRENASVAGKKAKKQKGKELGAAYKSRKAGGDVKRKNQQFEPYAFVPLDGKAFSKKNRRTAVDQMSTVVRGKGKKAKR